jgi:hypothetical protein
VLLEGDTVVDPVTDEITLFDVVGITDEDTEFTNDELIIDVVDILLEGEIVVVYVGLPGVTVPVANGQTEGVNETDGLPDTDLVRVRVTVTDGLPDVTTELL